MFFSDFFIYFLEKIINMKTISQMVEKLVKSRQKHVFLYNFVFSWKIYEKESAKLGCERNLLIINIKI
jgi:hypothetical protein